MPFVDNQGVSIHYEVEGQGPSLFLVHGLMGSHEDWIDNRYVEQLKDEYELIRLDLRGHGFSDKSTEPEAYRLRPMVEDIISVMDDLEVSRSHFVGYSLGGYIGLGLTKYALNRLKSLTVFDYGPYQAEHLSNVKETWAGYFNQGKEFMISALTSSMTGVTPTFYKKALMNWAEKYRKTDTTPYKAWCEIREQEELASIFPQVDVPCLFICAENGTYKVPAKEISGMIPDAEYILMKGLIHLDVWGRSDLVLPYVKNFLKKNS